MRYGYGYHFSVLGLVEEAIENYTELEMRGRENSSKDIISRAIHQAGMVYRQDECAEYSKHE